MLEHIYKPSYNIIDNIKTLYFDFLIFLAEHIEYIEQTLYKLR